MTSPVFTDADEPLSTQPRTRGQLFMASLRRRAWIYRQLARHAAQPAVRLGLVPLLLVSLTPATAIEAAHAAGPTSMEHAQLADFTFESIEPIADDVWDGFATKPLIVATDIGRPEKELREREERDRQRRADATRRARAAARAQAAAATTGIVQQPQPEVSAPTTGNGYAYGYCTWWVKVRRPTIPNAWGNANAWLGSAQRSGYATGTTPQVGAIVVTAESRYGHVGYVEAVQGDEIIVSDMNVVGWAKVSKRHMKISSGVIRGYIY
ncbi:CHAP domain-containing protein [Candidatus Berkelbacteria bacterium]|nr:CHAP domain-containing protein [Candidatus Berkelbacteria bacterium]